MPFLARLPVQIEAPLFGESAGWGADERVAGGLGGAGMTGRFPMRGAETGAGEAIRSIGGSGRAIAAGSRLLATKGGAKTVRAGGFIGAAFSWLNLSTI